MLRPMIFFQKRSLVIEKIGQHNYKRYCYLIDTFGITGDSHNWFTDYLFNRKQFCVVENCKSKLLSITCGLGPLLFLMFFNDFEKCLKSSQSINLQTAP